MSQVMSTIDPKVWRAARRALEKAIALYLKNPMVSHIDLGYRIGSTAQHPNEPELVVRIHVHATSANETPQQPTDASAPQFDAAQIGFPIEIIQASYSLHNGPTAATAEHTLPIHMVDTFMKHPGTIAARVRDRGTGQVLALLPWHSLATALKQDGERGLPRSTQHDAGYLAKLKLNACRNALFANIDAAVVDIDEQVTGEIRQRQHPPAVICSTVPQLGATAVKIGLGTEMTRGFISGILGYSIYHIHDQAYIIGPAFHITTASHEKKLGDRGDSGAWWLEEKTQRVLGMHFAGSADSNYGLALGMNEVLAALNIELDDGNIAAGKLRQHPLLTLDTQPEKLAHDTEIDAAPCNDMVRDNLALPRTVKTEIQANRTLDFDRENTARVFEVKSIIRKLWLVVTSDGRRISLRLVQLSLLLVVSMLFLNLCFYQTRTSEQTAAKLDDMKHSLGEVISATKIEQEREDAIKKIIGIIAEHNSAMSAETRRRIAHEIYEMSIKYTNLDCDLICATITHETGRTWNPAAISYANARGLMQILPSTGIYLANQEGLNYRQIDEVLFDPILNIRLGCRYLSSLIAAYALDGGLAAYNGGTWRAELWLQHGRSDGILREETALYIPSILKIYDSYQRMML